MSHPKDLTEAKERIRDLTTQLIWAREAHAKACRERDLLYEEVVRLRTLSAERGEALSRIAYAALGPLCDEASAKDIAEAVVVRLAQKST